MWKRLSARAANSDPDGPFVGVPDHLAAPLAEWIQGIFAHLYGMENTTLLRQLAVLLRFPKRPGGSDSSLLEEMLNRGLKDPNFCLDFIDAILTFGRVHPGAIDELDTILAIGGSVWTVGDDRKSLTEVLDATAQAQGHDALNANDRASAELAEAWSNAYGRTRNASDAWDHAIKAVEEVLKPIITPNNAGATMGGILGALRSDRANPSPKFTLSLRDNGLTPGNDPIIALEGLLHVIWPNPDRHGGPGTRIPPIEEAQAVVQLAVTIVQWARAGVIK